MGSVEIAYLNTTKYSKLLMLGKIIASYAQPKSKALSIYVPIHLHIAYLQNARKYTPFIKP